MSRINRFSIKGNQKRKALYLNHQQVKQKIENAILREDILKHFEDNNIQWYLLRPEDTVSWEPDIKDAFVYSFSGVRVYEISHLNHKIVH